ncbi:hypothetical protein ACQ4M4_10345 [Leptolyngbya sp. AN02str]|uniref:hypothetical protein n=1 Tax=Leptolyngbya sp. AN02str TaxID=3423363 RepID=UPI003D31AA06
MKRNQTSTSSQWKAARLIGLSNSLEGAFGVGVNTDHENQDEWTTESLVRMSQAKGRAYFPGL